MNIRENLLEDKLFLATTIIGLIDDEKIRIYDHNLANRDQWISSVKPITESILKNAYQHRNWKIAINHLSGLHNLLKSIVLPGDFEKYTSDQKFYIALDLPYEGEQFYDLSSILKKDDKGDKDKKEECTECEKEDKIDDKPEECDCTACSSDQYGKMLVASVGGYLKKVAEMCGSEGRHDSAYMIEKTIRTMIRKVLK